MGILSDQQIIEMVSTSVLGIEPFRERNLTPNGYDLTIREVLVNGGRINEGRAIVEKGQWFAVSTEEYFRMPGHIAGELWIRTTWARRGVVSSFGMVDAGFHGELTLSAYASARDIEIAIGDRFAQIVFHTLERESGLGYSERSGTYHGQRGVTLDRAERG